MIFAKVDVDFYDHPRFLAAGPEATGLWLAALAYTRKHELDGKVPRAAVLGFFGGDRQRNEMSVRTLADAGLVTDDGTTITVLNYAEKNETKASIAERRRADASRKQASRSRSRPMSSRTDGVTDHVTDYVTADGRPGSDSGSVLISDPERVQGEPTDEPEPASVPKAIREQDYQRAYETGIAKGKGGPYAMPGNQRGDLHAALLAFAKWGEANDAGKPAGSAIRGDDLVEWIEVYACEFAEWVNKQPDERTAAFYSSFGPKGFAKWLNETSRKREARRVG